MHDFHPDSDKPDLPNFKVVNETLLRGGQPTGAGLDQLKRKGVTTVINLREESASIEFEKEICLTKGLDFVSIPLRPFDIPSPESLERFLAIIQTIDSQPCFVHCLHGMDRTGLAIGLYRLKVDDWNFEQAYEEMLAMGFHEAFSNLTKPLIDLAQELNKVPFS
ncbi:MAG: tyrosine-protein phosphatase [Candidatus Obscuribacterales bacterium]|nr:tyrosine-protein phosphatase [Candidatus Obscuribacterales bacterium]